MRQKSTTRQYGKPRRRFQSQRSRRNQCGSRKLSPLEDPFCYESEGRIDLEKAVRAVGFLLTWGSDGGYEPLSGQTAHGLAQLLDHAADTVARGMLSNMEAHAAGADPYKIWNLGERPQVGKAG